ncbi:MFS transporter small subunit [Arthrobacter sp. zg-Y40]
MTKAKLTVSWVLVGAPLAYGIFQTVSKASALFG